MQSRILQEEEEERCKQLAVGLNKQIELRAKDVDIFVERARLEALHLVEVYNGCPLPTVALGPLVAKLVFVECKIAWWYHPIPFEG